MASSAARASATEGISGGRGARSPACTQPAGSRRGARPPACVRPAGSRRLAAGGVAARGGLTAARGRGAATGMRAASGLAEGGVAARGAATGVRVANGLAAARGGGRGHRRAHDQRARGGARPPEIERSRGSCVARPWRSRCGGRGARIERRETRNGERREGANRSDRGCGGDNRGRGVG